MDATSFAAMDWDDRSQWGRSQKQRLALACSYCGSPVFVNSTWSSVECTETSCGAEWSFTGECTKTPAQFRAEVEALSGRW
jgi:hypothetical protein